MSTDFDDYQDDDADAAEAPEQTDRNPLRAQLRKLEKENKALRVEAENGRTATKNLAFAQAGVPLDDPRSKWFVNGYDGDVTPEAIKAAAVVAGLVEAPPEADQIPQAEKDAHTRIAATSNGASPPPAHDFDQQIADAKATGNFQRVIELKQAQSAEALNR